MKKLLYDYFACSKNWLEDFNQIKLVIIVKLVGYLIYQFWGYDLILFHVASFKKIINLIEFNYEILGFFFSHNYSHIVWIGDHNFQQVLFLSDRRRLVQFFDKKLAINWQMKTRVADLNHLMQNELIWKQILVLKIVVNLVRTVANMASKMTMHHCWFNLIFL